METRQALTAAKRGLVQGFGHVGSAIVRHLVALCLTLRVLASLCPITKAVFTNALNPGFPGNPAVKLLS